MSRYNELKEKAQQALKNEMYVDAIQYWQIICETFPNKINSYIELINSLMAVSSLKDIANAFEQTEIDHGMQLRGERFIELINSFEIYLENGDVEAGINQASKILNRVSNIKSKSFYLSWHLFIIEKLNFLYHKRTALKGKKKLKKIFINLSQRGSYSEAIIFSPVILSRGKFSLLNHYLSLFKDANNSINQIEIIKQIEIALIAYQLDLAGEKINSANHFKTLISSNTCKVPEFIFEFAYLNLCLGNGKEAIEFFIRGLNLIEFTEIERNVWLDSFKIIVNYYDSKILDNPPYEVSIENKSHYQKIFFSGFGWSGSGAVYDFFKENTNVNYMLPTEFTFIQGKHGIADLDSRLKRKSDIKDTLRLLFAKHLFGFSCTDSYTEVKFVFKAKMFSIHLKGSIDNSEENPISKRLEYAKTVRAFLYGFVNLAQRRSKDIIDEFRSHFNVFFDKVISLYNDNGKQFILLDNVIKAIKVNYIDLFENAVIFVVRRDPRSQYVSNYIENKKFHKDVNEFIESYKHKWSEYLKYFNNSENPNNIVVVQFEEFVLSEEYRNSLLNKAGLNEKHQEKHTYFKPWESKKNVYNYVDFPNQLEIKMIESELSSYLIEL